MPAFSKDSTAKTPFGKNVYLRSTRDLKFESYTIAASTVPAVTIDGTATKVLQPGTCLAKITSTVESGRRVSPGPVARPSTDREPAVVHTRHWSGSSPAATLAVHLMRRRP